MKVSFDHARVAQRDIERVAKKLHPYLASLRKKLKSSSYTFAESSMQLPFDERMLEESKKCISKKVSRKLKYVLVIGIGGSSLGAQALYDALLGFKDRLPDERAPRMFFFDTIDGGWFKAVVDFGKRHFLLPEEVLIICISKSGTTVETIAQLAAFRGIFEKRISRLNERIVYITDEGSRLWEFAKNEHSDVLSLPSLVGGRYSVCSAVGIVPLLAVGIRVDQFLAGAREMVKESLQSGGSAGALHSAATLYALAQKGYIVHNLFLFVPRLETLARWHRQLLAESLGKRRDRAGKRVQCGILPVVSIGSTDLHSLGQFYFGGPRMIATTFITAPQEVLPKINAQFGGGLVPSIADRSAHEVMDALSFGAMNAYKREKLPFLLCEFDGVNEYEIGKFMQWKMIETMFLGELWNVNAFDQPEVELYKAEAREILKHGAGVRKK